MLKSISQSFKFSEKDFQRIFQTNLKDKSADPYKILGASRNDNDDIIISIVIINEMIIISLSSSLLILLIS